MTSLKHLTARRMEPLIAKGRAAFALHSDHLPIIERPIGITSSAIVTRSDFLINVELCLEYVMRISPTILILCEGEGTLCVVFSRKGPDLP